MGLRELLQNLRIDDLKTISTRFDLENVRSSGKKSKIIKSILESPSLRDESLKASMSSILKEFVGGGKCTLTLYLLNTFSSVDFSILENLAGIEKEMDSFRFKLNKVELDGEEISTEWLHPSSRRQVDDYYNGPSEYTPISYCRVILRKYQGMTLLDVRASRMLSDSLAKLISIILFGTEGNNVPSVIPVKVTLSSSLSAQLKERFGARTFKLKVLQDDELGQDGYFHARATELTTTRHDFDQVRQYLYLQDSSEDTAHGLEFDVDIDGLALMSKCKIFINFNNDQISFLKLTPKGGYRKVIDTVLELSHEP